MPISSKTILDSLPDPVIVLDDNRIVTDANKAALELMPADTLGRDLAHSFRHPAALEVVDAVLKGKPVLSDNEENTVEITYTDPLRRSFSLYVVQAMAENESDGMRTVLFLRETTADKRAEQMRVDFVANVSHELRSPLSALVGFIETIQNAAKDDPKAQKHFLEIMAREAGRMSRLIEDLLSLSSVEMSEHVRPRDPIQIQNIAKSVIESLSVRAAEKNLTINFHAPDSVPLITGDADQLIQIIQNLIDNAIKYGGQDSTIDVKIENIKQIPEIGGPGIVIAIQDYGEGIPEEQISRLTERFYRIDKARSRSMGGTGLGLAIVKHIINRHRGSLLIESELGQGSTFSIALPLVGSIAESPDTGRDDSASARAIATESPTE